MPGYRPEPPDADRLVRWPADWGVRYTLFVDTEEEFDWRAPLSSAERSVRALAALPAANRRLRDGGAAATYLVDHPVATDPAGIDAVRAALADGADVGTQLHPWVNPPFGEEESSFPGALPPALEAAKLDVLTAAITTAFGRRPIAYRAGRYGIGPNTAALLAARGYRLDTSMRARYDYRPAGGPDFRAIGPHAFRLAPGLVELPLTTVFTGRWRRLGSALHPRGGRWGRGALARAGLIGRVALTPEDMPLADAQEAVRVAVGEGVQLLNFAFHSPSLAPGHTPYVRDAADLAAFWRWWDAMLALLARLGVPAAALHEVIAATGAAR